MVFKWCFYVGVSLCRLCVLNVFGARDGFDVDASHVFTKGVLTAITLTGVECLVLEELKPVQHVKWDLFLAWWVLPSCQGWGLVSCCWSRSPETWAQSGYVPFESVFCPNRMQNQCISEFTCFWRIPKNYQFDVSQWNGHLVVRTKRCMSTRL